MRLLGHDDLLWERSNPYFMSGDDEARWAAWIEEDRAALRVSTAAPAAPSSSLYSALRSPSNALEHSRPTQRTHLG